MKELLDTAGTVAAIWCMASFAAGAAWVTACKWVRR
jgi:hypothetical protein